MQKNKVMRRGMQLLVVFSFVVMLAGIGVFFMHYPGSIEDYWNAPNGELIFTAFSAFFSALNVLVFLILTVVIENQDDKRQEERTYYDGLRYKQTRQKELSDKFDGIANRYISPAYFEAINSFSELIQAEAALKEDEFICLAIRGLEKAEFSTGIFKQILSADLQELGGFIKSLNAILEKCEKDKDFSKMKRRIVSLYAKKGRYIPASIIGIKEGILLDTQLTFFETMGQTISTKLDTMPPESQRYLNKQRREQQNV